MAARTDQLTVEHSQPGERLDVFLRTQFPAASRGTMQRLIEQGHILVNGKPVKATHKPRAGEKIDITWPDARPAEALPEEIPLDISWSTPPPATKNTPW